MALRFLIWLAVLCIASPVFCANTLTALDGQFYLDLGDGRVMTSHDLVGSVLMVVNETSKPLQVKIAGVMQHPQMTGLLLHDFQVKTADGIWVPLCQPDALGLRMGFPIAGGWDENNRFIADPNLLFVTCTSGSQGKCVIFGYDPWKQGPKGESLIPLYEACQMMVRAAYCDNRATTTDGTAIDYYDALGIESPEAVSDESFAFEAGWTAQGAVCVAHPRHPEVIGKEALLSSCPKLSDLENCTEATAAQAGAILFNRSRSLPVSP
jgi:hypothetical protein